MAFFFPFSTILTFSVIASQLQKVSYHVPKGELLDDDSSPFEKDSKSRDGRLLIGEWEKDGWRWFRKVAMWGSLLF